MRSTHVHGVKDGSSSNIGRDRVCILDLDRVDVDRLGGAWCISSSDSLTAVDTRLTNSAVLRLACGSELLILEGTCGTDGLADCRIIWTCDSGCLTKLDWCSAAMSDCCINGEVRVPEVCIDSNDILDEIDDARLLFFGASGSAGFDAFRGGRGGAGRATRVGPDTNLCRKGLVDGCRRSPYKLPGRIGGGGSSSKRTVEVDLSFGSLLP